MGYFSRDRRLYRSLVSAIGKKDFGQVQALFAKGATAARPAGEKEGNSPLFAAARANFVEGIEFLLEKGADVEGKGVDDYRSPLHLAAYMQNEEAVLALLRGGADINARMPYKETALHEAQQFGHDRIFAILLDHGADINAQKLDGTTALHYAAQQGKSEVVRMLLDRGADPAVSDRHMNTAADAAQKDYPKIAEMIRARLAPETPAERPSGWQLTAADEVARVTEKKGIGYRVTEIFNFNARLYTQIASNLETSAESQAVKGFAELDDGGALNAARAALAQLGGKAADNALDKKKLPSPGQGG